MSAPPRPPDSVPTAPSTTMAATSTSTFASPPPAPPSAPVPRPPPAIPFAAPSIATMAAPPGVRSLGAGFLPNTNPICHHPQHQILYTVPIRPKSTSQGILYPVASSGRGFVPPHKPPLTPDHGVTIANPNPSSRPLPIAFSPNHHLLRPPQAPPPATLPSPLHPKVTSPMLSSKSAANGFRDPRVGKDDALVVVRDRKVRLSDGDSLYGLGRSWLRNGYPEERMVWRSQYGDFAKTLPRPQPIEDSHPIKEEGADEGADKEENVDALSAEDLLKGHIRRAKRVRMRAKEERMRRISRFRTRIRLLLPPSDV